MSDDNAEILKAIKDLAIVVETYHGDFREFRSETKTKIQVLESAVASARLWSKLQTLCIAPVVGILHQVAKHYGY